MKVVIKVPLALLLLTVACDNQEYVMDTALTPMQATVTASGEGCAPGFWKQRANFASWPSPYTPATLFSAIFEDAFPRMSLADVLRHDGGGLNALGRHTVAALLNSASSGVNYGMTSSEVIAAFNSTYPGTLNEYEKQREHFEALNRRRCPLSEGEVSARWVLYGVNADDDGLSVIDPLTGQVTFVGPLDPDPNKYVTPISMAVRPSDRQIFVWNNSSAAGVTGVLLAVDPCTGQAVPANPLAPPQGAVGELAAPSGGFLFGAGIQLTRVNPITGLVTVIGPPLPGTGISLGGADFNANGILYGVELTVAGVPERLITIDTITGNALVIGTLNPEIGTIGSIVFDPNGRLLGSAFGPSNRIFEIDPKTAAVSNVITLTGGTPPFGAFAPQGMGFAPPCSGS